MSSEPGIFGETQVPFHNKEGNEGEKRCALLFQDQEFIYAHLDRTRRSQLKAPFAIGSMVDQSVSFCTKALAIRLTCPRPMGAIIKDHFQKNF